MDHLTSVPLLFSISPPLLRKLFTLLCGQLESPSRAHSNSPNNRKPHQLWVTTTSFPFTTALTRQTARPNHVALVFKVIPPPQWLFHAFDYQMQLYFQLWIDYTKHRKNTQHAVFPLLFLHMNCDEELLSHIYHNLLTFFHNLCGNQHIKNMFN